MSRDRNDPLRVGFGTAGASAVRMGIV